MMCLYVLIYSTHPNHPICGSYERLRSRPLCANASTEARAASNVLTSGPTFVTNWDVAKRKARKTWNKIKKVLYDPFMIHL